MSCLLILRRFDGNLWSYKPVNNVSLYFFAINNYKIYFHLTINIVLLNNHIMNFVYFIAHPDEENSVFAFVLIWLWGPFVCCTKLLSKLVIERRKMLLALARSTLKRVMLLATLPLFVCIKVHRTFNSLPIVVDRNILRTPTKGAQYCIVNILLTIFQ